MRPKDKGTAWETAICAYLRETFPQVERRTLGGSQDKGDIAGIPEVVIEAKNTVRLDLAGAIAEVEAEVRNARATVGVAWIKRKGKTSPGAGYVVMTGEMFVALLKSSTLGR